MDIKLANPRGFCAGVDRAIAIVKRALQQFGAPVYVRHEVVHNRHVVQELETQGAVFVDELDEIPDHAVVIFSAHGVSQAVRTQAAGRRLNVFDATCPLVNKVHVEVARYAREARECILIGHAGHPEVEGTLGQYLPAADVNSTIRLVETVADVSKLAILNPDHVGYVTQTTLSLDETRDIIAALRERFPSIVGPSRDDICYATQNRQDAVRRLAAECDVFLVVGSTTSSNSNRLVELARKLGVRSYLVDGAADLRRDWFVAAECVGVSAGASAPEILVQEVVARLCEWGGKLAGESAGAREGVVFSLPQGLRQQGDIAL
jgi:4-hydroxy-3-methylbut-2-enyl diphosphate reductase